MAIINLSDEVTVVDYTDGTSGWIESITRQWGISSFRTVPPANTNWHDSPQNIGAEQYGWIKDTRIRTISNPGIPFKLENDTYYYGPFTFETKEKIYFKGSEAALENINGKTYVKGNSENETDIVIKTMLEYEPVCQTAKDGKDGAQGPKGDKGEDGTSPTVYSLQVGNQVYPAGKETVVQFYVNKTIGNSTPQNISFSFDNLQWENSEEKLKIKVTGLDLSTADHDDSSFTITKQTQSEQIAISLYKNTDTNTEVLLDKEIIDRVATGTYVISLDNDNITRSAKKTGEDSVTATLYYGEQKVAADWKLKEGPIGHNWTSLTVNNVSSATFSGTTTGEFTISAKISGNEVATKKFRVMSYEEGSNAKYVVLSASSTNFVKNSTGGISPDSITLTADIVNKEDNDDIQYTWLKDGTLIQNANSKIYIVSKSSYSGQHNFKCVVNINGRESADVVTISLLENGQDGADGEAAYTFQLKDSSFNIPANSDNIITKQIELILEPQVWKGTTSKAVSVTGLKNSNLPLGLKFSGLGSTIGTLTIAANTIITDNFYQNGIKFTADNKVWQLPFQITVVPAGEKGEDGVDGEDAYSIASSANFHKGTLQTDDITFYFNKGKTSVSDGYKRYKFNASGAGWTIVGNDKTNFIIEATNFINQNYDLMVEWWSKEPITGSNAVLWDSETIEYVGGVTLISTNDTIVIPCDANGGNCNYTNAITELVLVDKDGNEIVQVNNINGKGAKYNYTSTDANLIYSSSLSGENKSKITITQMPTDSIILTCTAKYVVGKDSNNNYVYDESFTRTKNIQVIKQKQGIQGDKGEDGAKGDTGESAVQYEIVSDYDEIGVCYEKDTTNGTVSKKLQYFPNEKVNLKLYKINGSLREQISSGKLYYGFSTTQLSNLTELSFASSDISLSIENIKFTDIKNENEEVIESAEQQYSKFKDKDRYIYIVYKDDNEHILTEKWIYLVHATSSILANFETTAFGFNDLTEDGTKGIKFEAAGGMNFYAGDAKGQGAEKNIITIWSGNANGIEGNPTYHGEKVFYVTNEGNVELNSANIRGSLMSKKQEEISLLSQSNYFLISENYGTMVKFDYNNNQDETIISYSASDFWTKDYSEFTDSEGKTVYLFTNIQTDLLPSFGIKESFIYDNDLNDQILTITFSDENSFKVLGPVGYYSIDINLVYITNNFGSFTTTRTWYSLTGSDDIKANASYSFNVSAKTAKNYLEEQNVDITNLQLLGFKICINYNAPENEGQITNFSSWLGEKYIYSGNDPSLKGIYFRTANSKEYEPLDNQADINSIQYLFKDITYTTYAYYFSDSGTSILRNKQYVYSLYSPKIEAACLDLVKIGSPNKISLSSDKVNFWQVKTFLYPVKDMDAKGTGIGKVNILSSGYYSTSHAQDFATSKYFYFYPHTYNKYITETTQASFGTLYTPKIDFNTETSAMGNISISGDEIQIIRGQIDSSGNISASDYIGNQYRDGFTKAPIQIKNYGTVVDDTYIPALSFQDVNDTSMNDSNENVQTFWTMGYRNNLKCFEILGVDIIGNGIEQGMGGIRIPKSMVDGRHLLNMDEFIYLKRKYCGGKVKLAAQSHYQFSTNPASLADPKGGLIPIAIAAEPSGDPGVITHPNGWIHNSKDVEATIYGVFYYFLYVPSWLWYLEG